MVISDKCEGLTLIQVFTLIFVVRFPVIALNLYGLSIGGVMIFFWMFRLYMCLFFIVTVS